MNTYIVTTITKHVVETVVKGSDADEALDNFHDGFGNQRCPEFIDEDIKSVEIEPKGAW